MNSVIVCKNKSHGKSKSGNEGFWECALGHHLDDNSPCGKTHHACGHHIPWAGDPGLDKVQEGSRAAVHRHAIISDYGCKVITLSSYCHCDFLALKGCNLDL